MSELTVTKSGTISYHPQWMREIAPLRPIPEPTVPRNRSLDQVERMLKRLGGGNPHARDKEGRSLNNGFCMAATDGYRALLRPGPGREPVLYYSNINTLPERSILLGPEIYLPLKRMQICANPQNRLVIWHIHPHAIILTASGEDEETGQGIQGKEFAPLVQRNGFFPCFRIGLSSKFVLDILGITWPLELRFSNPDEPVVFRPLSDEWRYVLMPVRF